MAKAVFERSGVKDYVDSVLACWEDRCRATCASTINAYLPPKTVDQLKSHKTEALTHLTGKYADLNTVADSIGPAVAIIWPFLAERVEPRIDLSAFRGEIEPITESGVSRAILERVYSHTIKRIGEIAA
jgi:hypothetical protein